MPEDPTQLSEDRLVRVAFKMCSESYGEPPSASVKLAEEVAKESGGYRNPRWRAVKARKDIFMYKILSHRKTILFN